MLEYFLSLIPDFISSSLLTVVYLTSGITKPVHKDGYGTDIPDIIEGTAVDPGAGYPAGILKVEIALQKDPNQVYFGDPYSQKWWDGVSFTTTSFTQ